MIRAAVVLDEAYWQQVYRLFGQPGRFVVPFLGALVLGSSVFLLLRGDVYHRGDGNADSYFLLAVGCLLAGSPWIAKWTRQRAIRRKSALNSSLSWTISREGLAIDGLHVKGMVHWEGFSKVVCRAEGLLIYSGRVMVHWIPATAFASRAEFEEAIRLIPAEKITKK